VNNTHLSSRVGRLNPDQSPEKENAAFQQAMMIAGGEFMEVFYLCAFIVDSFCITFAARLCVCYLLFFSWQCFLPLLPERSLSCQVMVT
jgi:hypothetical protein